MEELKISRGFDLNVAEQPDLSLIRFVRPDILGCSTGDIPFIRPKLLVKEGQDVRTGQPLFTDKRNLSARFVSPGTGRVEKILYGARRRLMEVVIQTKSEDEYVEFNTLSLSDIAQMPKEELISRLQQGGVWQGLRQFPVQDSADPSHVPAMIILGLEGNDIFSPHPAVLLTDNLEAFEAGMAVLRRFSHRIVTVCRKSSLGAIRDLHSNVAEQVTHMTSDIYPAWNPGAVLYRLKQQAAENSSWCIRLDHLLMIGRSLLTGCYPVEKIVTVTRPGDSRPHILTRQGVSLSALSGIIPENSLVTTGRFNGRVLDRDAHLGFFENTVNIIEAGPEEEMFGFVRPGMNKPSVSATFLSSLFRRPAPLDCTLHGEQRACINCSYCERICPNGLLPSFIMKALHGDDLEEALNLGLLDCCKCGLCSYACPSKIELSRIFSDAVDAYYKEKS